MGIINNPNSTFNNYRKSIPGWVYLVDPKTEHRQRYQSSQKPLRKRFNSKEEQREYRLQLQQEEGYNEILYLGSWGEELEITSAFKAKSPLLEKLLRDGFRWISDYPPFPHPVLDGYRIDQTTWWKLEKRGREKIPFEKIGRGRYLPPGKYEIKEGELEVTEEGEFIIKDS